MKSWNYSSQSYPEAASDIEKDLYRVLDEFKEKGIIIFSERETSKVTKMQVPRVNGNYNHK